MTILQINAIAVTVYRERLIFALIVSGQIQNIFKNR